ncbi:MULTISPECIES: RNA 2',3'-cyclic phosphodiesterase [unclassified Haloparvum]|uniref:RNA 2',3'-cyclic phosphodiesterase n=1 Tax=Haloparvum sp. PAK95 TaxID=3418962 RepID=UPI003D2ECD1E
MRAFLSVDLPDELATPFSKVQEELQGAEGLNFTDPDQAHVTLKFLGKVPDDEVDDVIDAAATAVDAADVEPFETNVGGLGVFPSLDYISVVWVGVDGGAVELSALHEALEDATTDLGYAPEEHEFTPHFTLARMNDARGKEIVQEVVRDHNPTVGTFTVDEVRLKESHLTEDGPEYETVESFEL